MSVVISIPSAFAFINDLPEMLYIHFALSPRMFISSLTYRKFTKKGPYNFFIEQSDETNNIWYDRFKQLLNLIGQ